MRNRFSSTTMEHHKLLYTKNVRCCFISAHVLSCFRLTKGCDALFSTRKNCCEFLASYGNIFQSVIQSQIFKHFLVRISSWIVKRCMHFLPFFFQAMHLLNSCLPNLFRDFIFNHNIVFKRQLIRIQFQMKNFFPALLLIKIINLTNWYFFSNFAYDDCHQKLLLQKN